MTEISVAAELARLRVENARLLKTLELSPQQARDAQSGFFDAPPGPVHKDGRERHDALSGPEPAEPGSSNGVSRPTGLYSASMDTCRS